MYVEELEKGFEWQVRITITQAPYPYQEDLLLRDYEEDWQEPEHWRTFLFDPIGSNPPKTHGVQFIAGQKLEIVFYTNACSREEGFQIGHSWLSSLRYKFLGLDGVVEVVPLSVEFDILDGDRIYELVIPGRLTRKKVNLIKKFVSIFYNKSLAPIKMILAWQREENRFGTKFEDKTRYSNSYKLRLFFTQENGAENDYQHLNEFLGSLSFMALDLETHDGCLSRIERVKDLKRKNLDYLEVFNNPHIDYNTVNVREMTFDFPEDLPLPKLPIITGENIRYIDVSEEYINRGVSVGNHLKDGVITDHLVYVPINKLPQDMAIFGKSGSGKTFFLARFIQELSQKAEKVGVLILNLSKSSQEVFYPDFKVLKYEDDQFELPYFYSLTDSPQEKLFQETATYICASLGLKNVFEKIIYRTQVGFMRKVGKLPRQFIQLLKGVETYIKNNPQPFHIYFYR